MKQNHRQANVGPVNYRQMTSTHPSSLVTMQKPAVVHSMTPSSPHPAANHARRLCPPQLCNLIVLLEHHIIPHAIQTLAFGPLQLPLLHADLAPWDRSRKGHYNSTSISTRGTGHFALEKTINFSAFFSANLDGPVVKMQQY